MTLPGFPPIADGDDCLGQALSTGSVHLRACRESDMPFLRDLYRQTRDAELAQTGWPEATKRFFCDSQFDLQHTHFVTHFSRAHFWVLHRGGRDIGRYSLDVTDAAWHVIDIAMATDLRGQGVGSALLRATRSLAPAMTLHVSTHNPAAMRLYARLGFIDQGEAGGMHRLMRAG